MYEYLLRDAIGKCLVEYDYHVHIVSLTESEMEAYSELTQKINANQWRKDLEDSTTTLDQWYRDRRKILENADAKIPLLIDILQTEYKNKLSHCLIYASEKNREQLNRINDYLKSQFVPWSQITAKESKDPRLLKDILSKFKEGSYKVLTAMRVLDEGVNIPQISTAFIIASTTVEKQWIQRRGRLLRKCEEIGKKFSTIHDFLVLPPQQYMDGSVKSIVLSELRRVREFAELARNVGSESSPLAIISEIENQYLE